jgi:hypothetical protein
VSTDTRPDRHALLELDALLDQITLLRDEGDAARFDKDDRYRWVLHRLWIAAGNEALAYTTATGHPARHRPARRRPACHLRRAASRHRGREAGHSSGRIRLALERVPSRS